MFTLQAIKSCSIVPQFHKFYLAVITKRHGRTHGQHQLSPGSKITAASFLELKSVKNLIIQPILDTNLNLYTRIPTAKTLFKFYLATQALTTRVKLRTTKDAHPKAHASRRTHRSLGTKTQQLRPSSPMLIQVL
ncbi:acetyl-CoA carboxylase 1-like [Dorcoceras hygrometricum]|uniref:Acetyl-CoA carboxylase 1-like n=1 Tax=Dorcoceras hygrometricum TaxID=472368 RepID=A0A2Z7BHJ6_9LAMI|nr:acetyl-CoA carboxylase 1-like [Dorcoceras hygrometricum]